MTTRAPASASISPSLVTVLTPVLGDAATTSCPFFRNLDTTFEPMRPPPPMTTIFMDDPLHLSIVERLVGENAHLVAGPTLFLGIGRHRQGPDAPGASSGASRLQGQNHHAIHGFP